MRGVFQGELGGCERGAEEAPGSTQHGGREEQTDSRSRDHPLPAASFLLREDQALKAVD